MTVTKEITIDMGHSVTDHSSRCRGLHGHTYRIIVEVEGRILDEEGNSSNGMVIDFKDLKQAMLDVIDEQFDHGFIIWEKDPRVNLLKEANDLRCFEEKRFHIVDFIPTAENLAKHWFKLLSDELKCKYKITLVTLTAYETPTSAAICTVADIV